MTQQSSCVNLRLALQISIPPGALSSVMLLILAREETLADGAAEQTLLQCKSFQLFDLSKDNKYAHMHM